MQWRAKRESKKQDIKHRQTKQVFHQVQYPELKWTKKTKQAVPTLLVDMAKICFCSSGTQYADWTFQKVASWKLLKQAQLSI